MKGTQVVMPEEQKVLINVAASGCVRTRRDAEDFCQKIEVRGWQRDLSPVYHAALALLRDPAAFAGLTEAQHELAKGCYMRMRKHYVDAGDCQCLRGPTGSVAVASTACPIHRGTSPFRSGGPAGGPKGTRIG
jgi:hypothetical protein